MSYITADRVKETTTIVGTGTVSLLGTSTGFRTFASQMTVGDTCSYIISNASGSEWESGIATYSAANTLTRTSVKSSSNSNNAVVFTAGVKDVFIGVTADSVVDKNNARLNTINAIPVASGVGNDLTLNAGSGVGVGRGGHIILTPGSQGSSGGNGKVLINGLTVGRGDGIFNGGSTVLGNSALDSNTGGFNNTAIGASALQYNQNGSSNVGVGYVSLTNNLGGTRNTAIGNNTLTSNTSGSNNIAIGDGAGNVLTTGSNNIFIGGTVYPPTNSTSDFLTIGNVIFASGGFGTGTTVGAGNVGIGQNAPTAKLHVTGTSASTKVAIVQGASSQTANLQEWQNSSGTALSYINASGTLFDNAINAVPVASGAGNNLTLTAGSGVTSGAGGNVVIVPGTQATSGGNGRVRISSDTAGTNYVAIDPNATQQVNFYCNTILAFTVSSYPSNRGYIGASSTGGFAWADNATGDFSNHLDLALSRDAADTLAQRRSTNAQTFRVYNTYTDASNYERLGITWASNTVTIAPQAAGTGTLRTMVLGNFQTSAINLLNGNYASGTTPALVIGADIGSTTTRTNATRKLGAVCGTHYTTTNASPLIFSFDSDSSYSRIGIGGGFNGYNAASQVWLYTAANTNTVSGTPRLKIDENGNVLVNGFTASTTGLTVMGAISQTSNLQEWQAASSTVLAYVNASGGLGSNSLSSITVASGAGNNLSLTSGSANGTGAGGNVTITAGNGSGVGAGGNIILQPGAQGTSGGNGTIQAGGTIIQASGTTVVGIQNTTTDANTVSPTPRISFATDRSGTAYAPYFFRGRLFIPDIGGNYGTQLCIGSPGGPESSGYWGEGIGRVIGNGGIAIYSGHAPRFWQYQAMCGITVSLGFGPINTSTDVAIGRSDKGVLRIADGTSSSALNTTGGSLSFPSTTTAFSANTNDLALTASAFQRINCTSAASLTGIAPPSGGTHVDGRMIRIYNVGTANLTLSHNSTSSTAANKMFSSTGADIILAPNDYSELIYDATSNGSGAAGWRMS